jgi:hypothetical protein
VRALRPRPWVLAGLFAAFTGCGGGTPEPSPSPSGIGAQVKAIEMDTAAMRDANGVANEVIRVAGDCDAARPLIGPAQARLDEIGQRVKTSTGQQTLDALKKKVREVAENCP